MTISSKIQEHSHSGATLNVIQEGGAFIVEKIIYSAISKNKHATIKQRDFPQFITSSYEILAIPVLDITEKSEILTIKMPYIEGIGGESISRKGNKITARNIKTALNSYLLDSFSQSQTKQISKNVFIKKLNEIHGNINSNTQFSFFIKKTIATVKEHCQIDFNFPIGPCHGDLTLSNIKITQDKQLYLFDFLDGFIESPLQDAVKLIQDMNYGWSFRNEKESLRLKGKLFCEAAYPNFIDKLFEMFPREMKVLEIITLLRIAPYIQKTDQTTENWLHSAIKQSLKKLED